MKVQVTEKFKVRTSKGEFELVPGQILALPEEKAKDLLRAGRVVPMIPEDLPKRFREHFEKSVDETAARYIPGTLKFIKEVSPGLADEIERAEGQINLLWLKAREGTEDLRVFQKAVDRWRNLHLRAIMLFSLTESHEMATQA